MSTGDGEGGGRGWIRAAARAARLAGALIGLALLASAGAILLLSQTVMGRQMAADFARDALQGAVRGEVRIGPVTGGNLLTGAAVERFEISGPDGRPFLLLRGVTVSYSPLLFLRERYVFREVSVDRGEIHLLQDSTGSWNFDRIFGDEDAGADTADAGDPDGPHVSLHDLRLRDGRLAVRLPMDPPSPGEPPVWYTVRDEDGALRRAMDVDSLSARFPRLLITDPEEPLTIQVEGGSGVARVVSQPLALRQAGLSAVFRDTVEVQIGRLSLGGSSISGEGWITGSDPLQYDFDLRADPLAFDDLRWLPLPVPRAGGGSMDLGLRSVGEDLAVDVRGGDVRSGNSRIRGGFTVRLSDPPRFDTLDLELAPYRLALSGELGADSIPMDGLVRGTVSGRGPMDGLTLDADLELRAPGEEAGEPSGIGARGVVGLLPPYRLRALDLEFRRFEPRWTRLVGFASRVDGRLGGGLRLAGRLDSAVSFRADLSHSLPGDSVSRVRGAGDVRLTEPPRLDVALDLRPLALASLSPYFPGLAPVGTVRGQVSANGPMDDLAASADLTTPRGELRFDGRFDLAAEERTYDARLTARNIQLQQWFDQAPVTQLAVQGSLTGTGTDPASLRARADLRILPSMVEGARVDSSVLRFRFADGLATVDTFSIRSDMGRIWGQGALGLETGRSGTLVLMADAPDLSEWNRWIVPGRTSVRPDTSLADLFEGLEREARAGAGEEPGEADVAQLPDTLSGELSARGVAFGNVHELSVGGRVAARRVAYGGFGGDSLAMTLDAMDPTRLDSLSFRVLGWGMETPVTRLDTLYGQITRTGSARNDFRIYTRRDTLLSLESRGSLAWEEDRRGVRLESLSLGLGERRVELERPGSVVYADTGLFVDSLRLRGEGGAEIAAAGRIPERGEASFGLAMARLPVDNLALLLPLGDTLAGTLDGRVRVTGTASEPRITGEFGLEDPRYGSVAYRELSGRIDYRDRSAGIEARLTGQDGRVLGRADGTVRANLAFRSVGDRLPEDPVDVTVRSDSLPMNWLSAAVESVREVRGVGAGSVRIRGEPGHFRFDGSARLAGGRALVPALGIELQRVGGALRFRDSLAVVDSLEFRSGAGGRGSVSGRVTLATLTDPGLDLELRARELRAMDRRKASVVLDGSGRLAGTYRAPELTGDFRVMNGDVRMEQYLREREVVDLTDPRAFALIDTTVVAERRLIEGLQNPFLQNMSMNVQLRIGPDLWLRSRELDVEVSGALRVRMQPAEESLALFGSLRLLRGTYRYGVGPYSRELRIESGTIEFVGTPGVNPNLNVSAVYRTRAAPGRIEIRATVGGTLLEKRLTLSSDPPLSESDQFCYLLVGTSCVGAVGPGEEGAGLARQVPRQLLGTVGTQLSSLLVEDAWLDYLNVSTAGYAGSGTGDDLVASNSLFAGTQLEAGKYLGRNFFVTVSQTFGSRLPGATVEWSFTEDWTLEARTENRFGRLGAVTLGSALEVDRTWGLFIFREWSW